MAKPINRKSREYFSDPNYVSAAASHAKQHACERLVLLSKWYNLSGAKKVLEIGCGTGELAPYISGWIGIDFSEAAIKSVKPYPGLVASADALPFRASQFDLVFAIDVLEHLCYPEKVINELLRVCRNKGTVIISSPQLIHRVLFRRDWILLENSQAIRNFRIMSFLAFQVFAKSFTSIIREFLIRIREETEVAVGRYVTFRMEPPPLVQLTPEKNLRLSDLDALYAVNAHNICCYVKSRRFQVINMKPFPLRLLTRATVDGAIVIKKSKAGNGFGHAYMRAP